MSRVTPGAELGRCHPKGSPHFTLVPPDRPETRDSSAPRCPSRASRCPSRASRCPWPATHCPWPPTRCPSGKTPITHPAARRLRYSQTQQQSPAYRCPHCFRRSHQPRHRDCGRSSMFLKQNHHAGYRYRRSRSDWRAKRAPSDGLSMAFAADLCSATRSHPPVITLRAYGGVCPMASASADQQIYRRIVPNGPRRDGWCGSLS